MGKQTKTKSKKKKKESSDTLDKSFAAALKAVENSPDSPDAWDHAESLADELQRPEDVAGLFRQMLGRQLDRPLHDKIAKEAVRFHEEWFGDDPDSMSGLFTQIIEVDPEAEWAFDRLTVELTTAKKWDELLQIYDRALASTQEPKKRKQLLDDASHVAKDFADQPGRAADYLMQLVALEPDNTRLASSLERLLERQERWPELIELWRSQIPTLPSDKVQEVRVRISSCFLDRVGDPAQALEDLRTLLSMTPGHADGTQLLERILEMDSAAPEIRHGALGLLRTNYDAVKKPEEVVRVLERGIEFADPQQRISIYREASTRLGELGEDAKAMEHCASLLRTNPGDTDGRRTLAQLADRSGRHDLHAQYLKEAADACAEEAQKIPLLFASGAIHRTKLDDAEGAIAIYSDVLTSPAAEQSVALSAAHILNDLLSDVGRNEDRLAVLDRIAELEQASTVRRFVLGEAARLALEVGEADRALATWTARLESDPHDLEALGELIGLHERSERWSDLVASLERRASEDVPAQQRRADLIRAARTQAEKLGDAGAAIDTWLRIREEFGDEPETISALHQHMSEASRWPELAQILQKASRFIHSNASTLLAQLGDVHRLHLDQPVESARFYEGALGDDPSSETAREGMKALLEVKDSALGAAEALTRAYESTDDWQSILDILEAHLSAATDQEERARILRRAARIQEHRMEDAGAALGSLSRAFCLVPADLAMEREFARLASLTQDWSLAARIYRNAAAAIEDIPTRAAQLRFEEGKILEEKLGEAAAAVDAFQASVVLDSTRVEILRDVARSAARAAQWDTAAGALVSLTASLGYVDADLVSLLENQAEETAAWDQLAVSLGKGVQEHSDVLRPERVQELELKVAIWHRDHGEDLAVAESAAQSAVAHGTMHVGSLRLLAELQRRNPGPDLVSTLLNVDSLDKNNLDALYEAAEVALESTDDVELKHSTLQSLYLRATSLWRASQPASGKRTVESGSEWGLERLVELHIERGDRQAAIQLLVDGTRLPFDPPKRRELRMRAASILAEMGRSRRAIELYREVLEEAPDDLETIRLSAELCEKQNRITELLGLRLRELDLTDDPDHKLELRLGISRLAGQFEERGGRVESLLANLKERPGHDESIRDVTAILTDRGQYDKLADILADQARKLEETEQPEHAAALWAQVAKLAEKNLEDVSRAIDAYSRVVELDCTNDSLDALARLHSERNEPAIAASWLEKRLETASEKERVPIRLRLARACIQADQLDQAISSLKTAFEEAPRNAEVRRLLIKRYRVREDWKPLAHVLVTAAEHVNDEATILAYSREAWDILDGRLGRPEEAVPLLEKAVSFEPDDRDLKRMLADGFIAANRHDDARGIIEDLIEGFGRRRSAQRAGVHLRLARVAHAQGDTSLAIEQLEQASKMDRENVDILRELAELARETGDHERAELAYQTLLMTVRRRPEDEEPSERIGPSEVLLELSRIAQDQGQEEQAAERLESSMEALVQNDTEASHIQNNLRSHEEYELLRRVLETRLEHVKSPRKRGRILSELADVLESSLDEPQESLDVRLEAIGSDPVSPLHHDAARELSERLDQVDRYVEVLETALKKARRDTDAYVRCELLLRLGEVMEKDKEDLKKAAKLYAKAEKTGVREIDVWRAAERVQGALGNTEEQMRLLNQLASMGEDQVETRASAFYSMAEVLLAHEDTLTEGLSTLEKALEDDPRYERAGLIMGRASGKHKGSDAFLEMYGKIARSSGDERMLLDYLELRSGHPEATPEDAHEAVDLALKFEEWDRAEELMLRAIEIGHSMPEELGRVEWALLALAERRMHASDLAGAVKWLSEAKDVGEPEHVFEIGRKVADLAAGPEGDLTLVAKLYESFLERYPTARGAWEPLADIYGKLGDVERLERLVDETLDSLQEVDERNALRLQQAKALMGIEEYVEDGVELLRTILSEDPEHGQAQALLIEHFEQTGRREDLVDLIQNNLMSAQGRRDVETIKDLSLRLGRTFEESNPDEALSVYRSALEWAPEDAKLLRTLLEFLGPDHDPAERAELMERMLGSMEGDEAAELALELAPLYESLGNEGGAQRSLELGYRVAPGNADLLALLEARYEDSGNSEGLARLLIDSAEGQEDPQEKIPMLLRAARIYRDTLEEPAAALRVLDRASELAPGDVGIGMELAACMRAAGGIAQAIDKLASILEELEGSDRLDPLRMRAALWSEAGNDATALEDLEEAFGLDTSVAPELEMTLERMRMNAASVSETEMERDMTMRLVELHLTLDRREDARFLLADWLERSPGDVDALHRLRDFDAEDGHWAGVAGVCAILAEIETGEARIDAVLRMSGAWSELGQPEEAREGLEKAHEEFPDSAEVRSWLVKVYEEAGVHAELARLLVEDALAAEETEEQISLLRRAGELLVASGEVQEAIPIFQDILETKPGDPMTTGALAEAYVVSNMLDEADTLLDEAISTLGTKRSPEMGNLLYRKSRIAEAKEDLESQLKWLHEAFKMDRHNGQIAAELANLAELIEDWDLALQALRAIALIKTGCPISLVQSLIRQGKISLRLGDTKRGLFFARKAKKEDPEDPEVRELLGMLGED